jgi:ankyrin repeat protein
MLLNTLLNMDNSARIVRPYKKTPTIRVPATPAYISPYLSQPQAAPSSGNSGVSPLAHGKLSVLCFLIYRAFDMNSRDEDDLIPLHTVSRYGHDDIARLIARPGL